MLRLRSNCRGQVIPLVALMLFAFLVLAALAIDMGVLYTGRTSSQHAADAAALAGAYTFLNPVAVQPGAAQQAAIAVAGTNTILKTPVSIAASDVAVDVPNRRVTVTVHRTGSDGLPTFFGRITGRSQMDVITTAAAEASATAAGTRCLKPIYVPNTILSYPEAPSSACTNGHIVFDSAGNVTTYAQGLYGTSFQMRPMDPALALAPGQFYSLDFGSGASTYSCSISQCLNQCGVSDSIVRCGDSYPLETGAMVGPTRSGINNLIGSPADTWVGVGQYENASGQILNTSRSLVIAPVWDNCTQVISPGYAGQKVKIIGFVNVFVDGMSGNNVMAHLAGITSCAGSGGSGGGSGGGSAYGEDTGPAARPVRLVN